MLNKEEIVISGLGVITPFASTVDHFWKTLISNLDTKKQLKDFSNQKVWKIGDEWKPEELMGKKGIRYMVPSSKYIMGASILALKNSNLFENKPEANEIGVVVGCNFTGMESAIDYDLTTLNKGPKFVSPMQAPNALANSPASQLGIRFGAKGSNTTITTGENAGLDSIGFALNLLLKNRANYVISGGVDHIDPSTMWLFKKSGLIPSEYSSEQGNIYSNDSKGIITAEGAGVAVLEKRWTAESRGVDIYAVVEGWDSRYAPSRKPNSRKYTLQKSISALLQNNQLTNDDIDLIISGANGMPETDLQEQEALSELLPEVPIFPIKELIGEAFGANGLLQLVAASGILVNQTLPSNTVKNDQKQMVTPAGLVAKQNSTLNRILLTSQNQSGEISTVMIRSN
ncbi:beta-ketoacyl-[acyl-carrier-protein] synthase family protein [Cytobacillus purgationiresistens]|uniref:3-oxoacyl-[acyl-carrier-protein] synthase II n=1 Tax=Cytobacillus purgationiresistens TaxID=863449 RepID=A0ABU0ANX9_9BACI|nr:beta-ketoacyl synthase [Cytobacillus purgationiresistens]MDQ0272997.1 3-oxoacyl-[acyl-carrier-protein] synthase II [Cytobacillus purgationiresistens]